MLRRLLRRATPPPAVPPTRPRAALSAAVPSSTPPALASLVTALRYEGFEVTDRSREGEFASFLELSQGRLAVRVAVERSEWWVDLGRPTLDDRFDPPLWAAVLDGRPPADEPPPLGDQVAWTLAHWREVQAKVDDRATLAELRRAQRARAGRRLGPKDFPARAIRAFAFLQDRGFVTTVRTNDEVRFESPTGVFVRVVDVPIERLVALRVGHVSEPRDALTDHELLTIEGVAEPHPTDVDGLAAALAAHGGRALAADPGIFAEAREHRRRYTDRYR